MCIYRRFVSYFITSPMRRKFLANSHPNRNGFTLIELLMVIAVILILAGITFGVSRGVQNAQARTKARAELATIAQAIEQFKSRYGDYPWHDLARPIQIKLCYMLLQEG